MKVKDWERWQTYRKDRGTPPWIKVYRNLFSNPEWYELSDAEKGHLISIWILSADKSGEIPDNPKVIQKMCALDNCPNVNKFIELGFLVSDCQPHGNHLVDKVAPNGCQHDAPETEQSSADKSRVEAETEAKKTPASNDAFACFWNNYPKKADKKKAFTAFNRLSKENQQIAINDVTQRFISVEKQFIPNATTYLHGERWNDEIIVRKLSKQEESDKFREWIHSDSKDDFLNNDKIIEGECSEH